MKAAPSRILSCCAHDVCAAAAAADDMQGHAAAAAARRRTPQRLTAANFKYFLRGRTSKAAAGDIVVAARRRVHLAPYDRALRAFRYRWVPPAVAGNDGLAAEATRECWLAGQVELSSPCCL